MHSDLLTELGWDPADPLIRDAVPALARGNNLVLVAPPAPPYAAPVLAGLIAHRAETGKDILVLAPPASLGEWASLLSTLARGLEPASLLAVTPGAAEQRLRAEVGAGVLVTSPRIALGLRERSMLVADRIGAVLIAWPETWEDTEVLALVLQDLPREVQRAMITADPDGVAALIERHAWRAMVVGSTAAGGTPSAHPVYLIPVPWARRTAVLPWLAERVGPGPVGLWTADGSRQEELRRAAAGLGPSVEVATGTTGEGRVHVAFDPPTPAVFASMAERGPVWLLAPPGTERWLARLAPGAVPVTVSEAADRARTDVDRRRAAIDRAIAGADLDAGFALLAPVFERHDPATVAAALLHLWREAERPAPAAPPKQSATAEPTTRIWVGAGRKDEINVSDLVGLLANEIRIDRGRIGRVDLRETFSLIEVPAADADRIAEAMTGRSIRKRRLVARVDRKPKG